MAKRTASAKKQARSGVRRALEYAASGKVRNQGAVRDRAGGDSGARPRGIEGRTPPQQRGTPEVAVGEAAFEAGDVAGRQHWGRYGGCGSERQGKEGSGGQAG